MTNRKKIPVSRRGLLKGSTALLPGQFALGCTERSKESSVLPQLSQERIYLAPDDHTDYFWTKGEEHWLQALLTRQSEAPSAPDFLHAAVAVR